MWYYTPRISLPFSIQIVQGDDEQLTRILASIPGKNKSIDDWTLVNVLLPPEKIKIYIRLNVSASPLAFDDLIVDYCDEPRPSPPATLFACDFESSCTENFITLPEYFYEWSVIEAEDAVTQQKSAPPTDYTFGNESGHYIWLKNSTYIEPGSVTYLATRSPMNFTSDETYCLNFQYYGYLTSWYQCYLEVYSMINDVTPVVQRLWPSATSSQYLYKTNQWTWGIVNLPVGYYSILFRVYTSDYITGAYALDNIAITSCAYPASSLSPYDSLLSFSCDFDNSTMCNMKNGDRFSTPVFNFTLMTGDTIPNRNLGPTRDHTMNSSSGGFLYWDRTLPYTSRDNGIVIPPKDIQQNTGMCIRFAYYIKSSAVNKNATSIAVSAGGCYGKILWYQSMDDSEGWQVVTIPVSKFACAETFEFYVTQREPVEVSVAFDDIEVAQCDAVNPSTTTSTTVATTTTTMTTTVITTLTSTTTSAAQSTSTQTMTTSDSTIRTSSQLTDTTAQTSSTISPSSNGLRLLFTYKLTLGAFLFLTTHF